MSQLSFPLLNSCRSPRAFVIFRNVLAFNGDRLLVSRPGSNWRTGPCRLSASVCVCVCVCMYVMHACMYVCIYVCERQPCIEATSVRNITRNSLETKDPLNLLFHVHVDGVRLCLWTAATNGFSVLPQLIYVCVESNGEMILTEENLVSRRKTSIPLPLRSSQIPHGKTGCETGSPRWEAGD
jgi:hypothetical protein